MLIGYGAADILYFKYNISLTHFFLTSVRHHFSFFDSLIFTQSEALAGQKASDWEIEICLYTGIMLLKPSDWTKKGLLIGMSMISK